MLENFNDWLSATALSGFIQRVFWILPAVQTVHILAISVVLASMAMFDLRLMGLAGRRHPIAALSRRFMPWLWSALVVLAASGCALIVGEPKKDLGNPVFLAKMIMLIAAILLTLRFQAVLKRDLARGNADLTPAHLPAARLIGAVSLLLWVGIAIAGRWIAYAGS